MVMGHELWNSLALKEGDAVRLRGRDFTLHKCLRERGTKDDITIWINLEEAQALLDRKGLINAILALECLRLECRSQGSSYVGAGLAGVRSEVAAILPGTQVKEVYGKALARAEARNRAAQAHAEALARQKASRDQLRRRREIFAAWLIPTVIVGCAAWIILLAYSNVHQRRGEIAILRAIGTRSRQISALVLLRSGLVGLIGAGAGYLAGLSLALAGGDVPLTARIGGALFEPLTLAAAVLAAPLACGLAAWWPAMFAGRQDPAVVLQQE